MNRTASFYLTRLRSASAPELMYRAGQLAFASRLKLQSRSGLLPSPPESGAPLMAAHTLQLPTILKPTDPELVTKIIAGHRFTLNTPPDEVKRIEALLREQFFADIGKISGDIRQVWEAGRLQHLTYVAIHGQRSDDRSERDVICRFLAQELGRWLDDNPFPIGPHYMSAMECGLRTPVFLMGIKMLAGVNHQVSFRLLQALYRHGWFIFRRLSLHSSLGNHTVAEALGLVISGAVFREAAEGSRWLSRGIQLLRQELHHQIHDDGGPAEQSLTYHRFVLDLYWLAIDFLMLNRLHDATDLKARLVTGEEFLEAFRSGVGFIPAIGDSDDGFAVAPGLEPKRSVAKAVSEGLHVFEPAGYSVLRSTNGTVITFDHGPLGMAPLCNHGHADALSITVARHGEPLLIDPGTCRYTGAPGWRRYFRGTSAHNTITVDGCDQAVQATDFVWTSPYQARLDRKLAVENGILLEGSHTGYTSLKQPVFHRRTLSWIDNASLVVEDRFEGEGEHDFLLTYHLHPDAALQREGKWWLIEKGGQGLRLALSGAGEFSATRGRKEPPLGWYSPAYGLVLEGVTLEFRLRSACADATFITLVCTEEPIADHYAEERLWNMKAIV